MEKVLLVVSVPISHSDAVREVMSKSGAGNIGNYSSCSFSYLGTGRFVPGPGSHPAIGAEGQFEEVEEERIEVVCDREAVSDFISAVRAVHPYEEQPTRCFQCFNIS